MIEAERKGDWIQTYTGKQFWPLDPRADEIDIYDIAAGLSNDCRYGGHCLRFYSVAEHSILMARYACANGMSARDCRAALLHDASEGLGLRDIPRPVKAYLSNYKTIEHDIMIAVAQRFDFAWPVPAHVKALDERIGLDEQAQNMETPPAAGDTQQLRFEASEPLGVRLKFWSPSEAFQRFLVEFVACGGVVP